MASTSEEQCSDDEEEIEVYTEEDSFDSMTNTNGSHPIYIQTEEGSANVFIISASELGSNNDFETEETSENFSSEFNCVEQLNPVPDKVIKLIPVPSPFNKTSLSTNNSETCGVRIVRRNLSPPLRVPCTQLPHAVSAKKTFTSVADNKLSEKPNLSYSVIRNSSVKPKDSEAVNSASFFSEDEHSSDYDSEHTASFRILSTSNKSPLRNSLMNINKSTLPGNRGLKIPGMKLPTSVTNTSITSDNSSTLGSVTKTSSTIIIRNAHAEKNQAHKNTLQSSVSGPFPSLKTENRNIQASKQQDIFEQGIDIPEHSIFGQEYLERNQNIEMRNSNIKTRLHQVKCELLTDDESSHSSDIFTDDSNFHFVSCDGGENLPFQSRVRISTESPKSKSPTVKQVTQSSFVSTSSEKSVHFMESQRFVLMNEDTNCFSTHNDFFTRGSQKRRRMLSNFSSFWHKSLEEQGLVRCPLRSCNYISLKFSDMCNHYAFCTGERSDKNLCSVCCYRLGSPEDLDTHMKMSHNNDQTRKNSSTSSNIETKPTTFEQLVEAPLTRKRSYSKVHVTSWRIALAKDGYVKCFFRNCNYLAMSLEEMIDHYRICKGNSNHSNFVCPYCKGGVKTLKILRKHIAMSHTAVKTEEEEKVEHEIKEEKSVPETVILVPVKKNGSDSNHYTIQSLSSSHEFNDDTVSSHQNFIKQETVDKTPVSLQFPSYRVQQSINTPEVKCLTKLKCETDVIKEKYIVPEILNFEKDTGEHTSLDSQVRVSVTSNIENFRTNTTHFTEIHNTHKDHAMRNSVTIKREKCDEVQSDGDILPVVNVEIRSDNSIADSMSSNFLLFDSVEEEFGEAEKKYDSVLNESISDEVNKIAKEVKMRNMSSEPVGNFTFNAIIPNCNDQRSNVKTYCKQKHYSNKSESDNIISLTYSNENEDDIAEVKMQTFDESLRHDIISFRTLSSSSDKCKDKVILPRYFVKKEQDTSSDNGSINRKRKESAIVRMLGSIPGLNSRTIKAESDNTYEYIEEVTSDASKIRVMCVDEEKITVPAAKFYQVAFPKVSKRCGEAGKERQEALGTKTMELIVKENPSSDNVRCAVLSSISPETQINDFKVVSPVHDSVVTRQIKIKSECEESHVKNPEKAFENSRGSLYTDLQKKLSLKLTENGSNEYRQVISSPQCKSDHDKTETAVPSTSSYSPVIPPKLFKNSFAQPENIDLPEINDSQHTTCVSSLVLPSFSNLLSQIKEVCVAHEDRSISNINLSEGGEISDIINIVDKPSNDMSPSVTITSNDNVNTEEAGSSKNISEISPADEDFRSNLQCSVVFSEITEKLSSTSTAPVNSATENVITCLPDITSTKCLQSPSSKHFETQYSNDQCESTNAFLEPSNELCDSFINPNALLLKNTNITQSTDDSIIHSSCNKQDNVLLESENHLTKEHQTFDNSMKPDDYEVPCSSETTKEAKDKISESSNGDNSNVALDESILLDCNQENARCINLTESHPNPDTCNKTSTSKNVNVAAESEQKFSHEDEICNRESKATKIETIIEKSNTPYNMIQQSIVPCNSIQEVGQDNEACKTDVHKFEENNLESDNPKSNVNTYVSDVLQEKKSSASDFTDTCVHENSQVPDLESCHDIEQSHLTDSTVGKSKTINLEELHSIDHGQSEVINTDFKDDNTKTSDDAYLKEKVINTISVKRKANENDFNHLKQKKSKTDNILEQSDISETNTPGHDNLSSSDSDTIINNENKEETKMTVHMENNKVNLEDRDSNSNKESFNENTAKHILSNQTSTEIVQNDVKTICNSKVLEITSNANLSEIYSEVCETRSDNNTFSNIKEMDCKDKNIFPDKRVEVIKNAESGNKRNDERAVESTKADSHKIVDTSNLISEIVEFENVETTDLESKPNRNLIREGAANITECDDERNCEMAVKTTENCYDNNVETSNKMSSGIEESKNMETINKESKLNRNIIGEGVVNITKIDDGRYDEKANATTEMVCDTTVETNNRMSSGIVELENMMTTDLECKSTHCKDTVSVIPNLSITETGTNIKAIIFSNRKITEASLDTVKVYTTNIAKDTQIAESITGETNNVPDNQNSDLKLTFESDQIVSSTNFQQTIKKDLHVISEDTVSQLKKRLTSKLANSSSSLATELPIRTVKEKKALRADKYRKKSYADIVKTTKLPIGADLKVTKTIHLDKKVYHNTKKLNASINNTVTCKIGTNFKNTCPSEIEKTKCLTNEASIHEPGSSFPHKRISDSHVSSVKFSSDLASKAISHLKSASIGVTTIIDKDFEEAVDTIKVTDYELLDHIMVSSIEDKAHPNQEMQLRTDKNLNVATYKRKESDDSITEGSVKLNEMECNETLTHTDINIPCNIMITAHEHNTKNSEKVDKHTEKFVKKERKVVQKLGLFSLEKIDANIIKSHSEESTKSSYTTREPKEFLNSCSDSNSIMCIKSSKNTLRNQENVSGSKEVAIGIKTSSVDKSVKYNDSHDSKAEESHLASRGLDEKCDTPDVTDAVSDDDGDCYDTNTENISDKIFHCDKNVNKTNNRFNKSKENLGKDTVVAEDEDYQEDSEMCKTNSLLDFKTLTLSEKRKRPSEFIDGDSKMSKRDEDATDDCLNVEICRLQSNPAKRRGSKKADQVMNGCSHTILENSKSVIQIVDPATVTKRKRGRPRKIRPEEEQTPHLQKVDSDQQPSVSNCQQNSESLSTETYTRSRRKVRKRYDPDFVEINDSSESKPVLEKAEIDESHANSIGKESECDSSNVAESKQHLRKRRKGVVYSFDNVESLSDDDYKVPGSGAKKNVVLSLCEEGDFEKWSGRGRGRGRGRPPKLRGDIIQDKQSNTKDDGNDLVSNGANKGNEISSEQIYSDDVNNMNEKVENENSFKENLNNLTVQSCSMSSEITEENETSTVINDAKKNVSVKTKKKCGTRGKGKQGNKPTLCNAFVKYELLSKEDCKTQVCCALCGEKMQKKEFYNHSMNKHLGMAHIEGDEPINTEDRRVVSSILSRIIKKRKSITCLKCGCIKKSAEGYLSHTEQCEKSEEEIEKIKMQCHICLRTMLPSSYKIHMTSHAQRKAETINVELDSPKGTRAAAARAVNKLQGFLSDDAKENDQTSEQRSTSPCFGKGDHYILSDNEVSKSMLTAWKKAITLNGVAGCRNVGCTFTSSDLNELSKHHGNCEFLTKKGFHCLKCTFFSDTEQQMLDHVSEQHSAESDEDSWDSDAAHKPRHRSNVQPTFKKWRVFSKVDFLAKSYNQSTRGRQPYLPALSWTLEFHLKNYSSYLFPDHHTQLSDWIPLDNTEVLEYLPTCPSSVPISAKVMRNETPNSDTNLEWKKFKLFESAVIKGVPTFFAGGPIWAMAWCTIPLSAIFKPPVGQTESQFLAVSCHKNMSDVFDIGCAYKDKGLIQIWDFGVLNNLRSCKTPPKFVLGIAHDYGTVWCLEWCPSGCYDTEESSSRKLRRLGLLAAACSDGTVRIFSVCFPSELPSDSQDRPVFKTEAALTLVLDSDESISSATRNFQCTRLSWFKGNNHKIIAAGFTNGIVALWNLDTNSPLLRRVVGRHHTLTPYFMFQPHLSIISALSLSPYGEGHYLMTGSFDRCTKLWNLEDVSVPLTSVRKGAITDGIWLPHWVSAVSSYEDSYSLGHSNVSLFPARQFGCPPYPLLAQNSSVWGLSSCDWLNGIAQGTLAGELCIIFSHQLLLSVDVEKGMKDKRVMISFVELKDLKKENKNSPAMNGSDDVENVSVAAVNDIICKSESRCTETIKESNENSMLVTFDESLNVRTEDSKSVMSYDSEDSLDSSRLQTPNSLLSEISNEVELSAPKTIYNLGKDSGNVSVNVDNSSDITNVGGISDSSKLSVIREKKCHGSSDALKITESRSENNSDSTSTYFEKSKANVNISEAATPKDKLVCEKQENSQELKSQKENIEVIYFTDIKNPTDIGLKEKKTKAKSKDRIFKEKGLSVFEQKDSSSTPLSIQLNTYGAVAERYGMTFCDFPLESFDKIPEESRLWMRQSDQMRAFPSEIYPLVSVNKVSWNPNCFSFLWLAAGCHNGFVRVPCVQGMHTPAVENFLRDAATKFNAKPRDKSS